MSEHIFPIVYAGNIQYFQLLMKHKDHILFDGNEHFVKQTYRNRTEIYGANGKLSLIIPLEKRRERTPMKKVKIAYHENWQKHHFKSLSSAYRSSPYFEYYEQDFAPFYTEKKYEYLVDFNMDFLQTIFRLLNDNIDVNYTAEYKEVEGLDLRSSLTPKTRLTAGFDSVKYTQVFESKEGFIPNLSILDLLFNEGPNAISFL